MPSVFRRRPCEDEGNLVLVLVLIVALSLLAVATLASLVPTFAVAHTSQTGEEAVAQANAGLDDALYHLDQLGDNVASFCVGSPPASLMSSAGLSSCFLTGSVPLSNAPYLQYYVARTVSSSLAAGLTDELQITSFAEVGGEKRTVTATVYRVADSFGVFGVSGFNANGALKQAAVYEVGGFPATSFQNSGTVYVGVGPAGVAACKGNSNGSLITTVGENGATNTGCPSWSPTNLQVDPANPTICSSGQVSSAFAPCIDTSSFATYGGQPYCPLWGSGIPNSVSTATNIASSLSAPSSTAVFDCASGDYGGTAGSAVTVGASSTGCPPTGTLPFGFNKIPAGSYYFDSNQFSVDNLDSCLVTGRVNFYVLPASCTTTSSNCSEFKPTSSSGSGSNCGSVPQTSDVGLALVGSDVNASPAAQSPFDFTPGDPSNFNLYWSGKGQVTLSKGLVLDGQYYGPSSVWRSTGTGYETFGSIVTNCMAVDGSPTFYLVYPEHPKSYLMNWTMTNYAITP
jgi:hypothetical protein